VSKISTRRMCLSSSLHQNDIAIAALGRLVTARRDPARDRDG
jgi:hypothetical protein